MFFRFALVVALATPTGCKKQEADAPAKPAPSTTEPAATTPPPPPTPEPAPPTATLNDAQIAAIVVAANQVDIEAGQLALKKAAHPEVKKFAERMITDHTAVNKAAVELVTKLKVTPEASDASTGLTAGGKAAREKLEALAGEAFDRAYVDNEVAYHQAVIDVLKSQLIPSAQNAELKSALVAAQPAFDAHLEHAKQIQATLAGGGTGSAHDHGK